jgi:polyisoprenoid-binding protein YceI
LAEVTGSFDELAGGATVDENGHFSGELVVPTRTLDTGIALRDRHLRGDGFFDVETYPEIRFTARQLMAGENGPVIRGELSVRDRSVELELPIELTEESGRGLGLTAERVLKREPLGLGRSPLGMIRGPVKVRVHVALAPDLAL